VQSSGFGVHGSGFRVQGAWFRVQSPGFRVQGSGFRVQSPGFRVRLHVLVHGHKVASVGLRCVVYRYALRREKFMMRGVRACVGVQV
jgi:hypothetical protein